MKDGRRFDVAVVGCGPSGATAAAAVAAGGASVVVLERRQVSEEKPCAGGIVRRALKYLPRGVLDSCVEDQARSIRLSCRSEDAFERRVRRPLFYTVQRAAFDSALATRAEQAGAKIIRGVTIVEVDVNDGSVVLTGDDVRVEADILIGADGVTSLVARRCGLCITQPARQDPALVIEVTPPDIGSLRARAAIDWDSPIGGYAWAFPKATHVTIGSVAPQGTSRAELRRAAIQHFEHYAGQQFQACQVLSERVAMVPVPDLDMKRSSERVMLVGDAAGLVDPFTREGITWALWSGKLAARAALAFLEKTTPLENYENLLRKYLLPELRAASKIAKWFFADPAQRHRRLRSERLVWAAFCSLIAGRLSNRRLCRLVPGISSASLCGVSS